MGELHHECGVAAVYHAAGRPVSSLAPIAGDVNSVARLVPRMLLDMQNRGQLAAGMGSFRPDRNALINTHKEVGTVAESFRLNHREEFEAIMEAGRRPGRDRPRALRHLRRQRSIRRPAVRARPRPQDEMVCLRVQWPACQL